MFPTTTTPPGRGLLHRLSFYYSIWFWVSIPKFMRYIPAEQFFILDAFSRLLLQLLARIPDVQTFFRGHVHMKCGTSLFLETFKQPPVIRSRCFPRINKSVQTLSCGISGCLYCNQGSCLLAISVLTAGSGHTYLHP